MKRMLYTLWAAFAGMKIPPDESLEVKSINNGIEIVLNNEKYRITIEKV